MLIRSKKSNEKIAMGLLSFMPARENVKTLQEVIQKYETDSAWELYLWKQEEDFIGLIGIEMGEESFMIQDLALNPSFRGEGIGKKMVAAIRERYPEKTCTSNELTEAFFQKCQEENEEC